MTHYILNTFDALENRQSMSHIAALPANGHSMDFIQGDAEASAPKRRCKDGSTQSALELLSADLAESESGLHEVEGCSDMDVNDCANEDSSLEVSAGPNEAATASDDCHYEPTRSFQIDPTSAFPPRPPKRFPRAFWHGLVRRAVAQSASGF
jgi:hypothetical protein